MSSKRLGISLTLAVAAALAAPAAHALHLNTEVFREAGGDPNNITATFAKGTAASYQRSLQAPFDAVGKIPNCTGTWIGNDDRHAWVMMAAHCVGPGVQHYWINLPTVSAAGTSRVYWSPSYAGTVAADVALVSIPLQLPVAAQWKSVTKPLLYDGDAETGRTVHFVGHGRRAIGFTFMTPPHGRLWGTSRVAGAFAGNAALTAGYQAHGKTDLQASAAPGDSGMAWWQQHAGGYWTIVGVHSTGGAGGSNSARLNRHIPWIKGLFPGAATFSERFTVTATQPFVSRNHAEDVEHGSVYYLLSPGQRDVTGPTTPVMSIQFATTTITAVAKDAISGAQRPILLRATRDTGCGAVRMENPVLCYSARMGPLRISYHPQDNVGLPSGEWKAAFDVDAIGGHRAYHERLPIKVDIRNAVQGRVQHDRPWQSPDFDRLSRWGVVYVVPPQAGASGSIAPGRAGYGTIRVLVREAASGFERQVVLRASRQGHCAIAGAGVGIACFQSAGPLTVRFDRYDNADLPAGQWRGVAYLRAKGLHDPAVDEAVRLDVEINR